MKRNSIVIGLIVVALGAILYILLPEDEKENFSQPFMFNRTVSLVDPPDEYAEKGVGDRVGRYIDRMIWGTNQSVHRSIDLLTTMDPETIVFETINRINLFRREQPSLAKDFIDLLAELKSPRALPALLDCAADPAEILSKAAIRGLSGFDDPESTAIMIEQARAGTERLRFSCMAGLASREDPAVFALFREMAETEQNMLLRLRAIEGLGNFETEESRRSLLEYLEETNLDIRTMALKSLLRIGSPEANSELEKMLLHEGPVRKINGVKFMAIARWLPPMETLMNLASHQVDNVRIYLTMSLLEHLEKDEGEQLQRTRSVLHFLLNDRRPDVRLKALEGLYKSGDVSVASPYLRKLSSAVGAELAEAVEIMTSVVESPDAPGLVMRRFLDDTNLRPGDRLVLLSGLATARAPEAVGLFFDVIRGGWNARSTLVGEFTLDRHAAFQVHSLGPCVLAEWEKFLEDEETEPAAYLYVNGLRNLGDPRSADSLLAIAGDEELPEWIRREAILSFAYLEAADVPTAESVGKKLLEFHRECRDKTIAGLAYKVFWNYL